MRRAFLASLCVLAGCAGPFDAVRPETRAGGVVARYCGSSGYRAASVVAAMDGPPLGETGGGTTAPREVTFCVELGNGGARPVRVNRNLITLHVGAERYGITADRDDERLIVPPGAARKLKVTYQYGSGIVSGQDAELRLADAITVDDRPLALPALRVRRR